MPFEAYLQLKDIKGESTKENYSDHIEVLSFEFGAQNPGKSRDSGRSVGVGQVHDFSFVKRVDQATPLLFQHCVHGKTFDEAVVKVVKSAGTDKPLEYLTYKFSQVLISSVSTGALQEGFPTEKVSMTFGVCKVDYQPQGSDGKPKGGPIHGGWDLEKGKPA